MVRLFVFNETEEKIPKNFGQVLVGFFCKILEDRIGEILKSSKATVNLIFVGDKEIHAINKKYRKKDEPTDVLSFSYIGDGVSFGVFKTPEKSFIVADIFISVDTAKKQALWRGHSLKREMEILFVHGLLHVFGFDHRNDKEEKEMEEYAGKILN
ncbi:rRNA maturation RNase YbeY [Candidatus Peregrinibacteria bacterium]|nr:rRNA maturation RNase YbeY [Candidatus Peregrinibacteria bacterium]